MNQRTMLIAKMLREGDFSDAEELIQLELEERSEKVSKIVGESIMHQIFESVNTKNVKGLGKVEVNNHAVIVKDVKDLDQALKLAPKFAEFVDGKGSYTAKASNTGDTITISKGGSPLYDLMYDDYMNTLEIEIEVSKEELANFRKNGRLDESFEEITEDGKPTTHAGIAFYEKSNTVFMSGLDVSKMLVRYDDNINDILKKALANKGFINEEFSKESEQTGYNGYSLTPKGTKYFAKKVKALKGRGWSKGKEGYMITPARDTEHAGDIIVRSLDL